MIVFKLFFSQYFFDDFFLLKLNTHKRILGHPFVSNGEIDNFLKAFHITDNRKLMLTSNINT